MPTQKKILQRAEKQVMLLVGDMFADGAISLNAVFFGKNHHNMLCVNDLFIIF